MNEKGVSLIELSIVMVILGLLLTIGIKIMTPIVERAKRMGTQEVIDAGVEAVIGYAEVHNHLPDDVEFATLVRNTDDVWGNSLIYISSFNLTGDEKSICERSKTDTKVQYCDDKDCSGTIDETNDVAFIILSRGLNLNIQTNTASDTISTFPYDLDAVDNFPGDMYREEPYKDTLKWVVLHELRVKAGCIGSPLKILNTEIPSGYMFSTYETSILADGGVPWEDDDAASGDTDEDPDYEWCVTESLPFGLSYICDPTVVGGELEPSATCDDPSDATEKWQKCTSLEISGSPTEEGTWSLPVYVADDGDNRVSRTFGLSITRTIGIHICEDYRVWNVGNKKDYWMDDDCFDIAVDAEITVDGSRTLQNGEIVYRYSTSDDNCNLPNQNGFLNYKEAIFTDNDADCCVNFDATDRVCPP